MGATGWGIQVCSRTEVHGDSRIHIGAWSARRSSHIINDSVRNERWLRNRSIASKQIESQWRRTNDKTIEVDFR
jgi:hypothetical protein